MTGGSVNKVETWLLLRKIPRTALVHPYSNAGILMLDLTTVGRICDRLRTFLKKSFAAMS